jgi:hypothetical protein
MKLLEALEIILDLAQGNMLDEVDAQDDALKEEFKRQDSANFLVSNWLFQKRLSVDREEVDDV